MPKHLLSGASVIALLAAMSAPLPAAADPPSLRVTINDTAARPGPTVGNTTADDQGSLRANRLDGTANGARGLLSASQNNGSNNAVSNATGVQVGGVAGTVATQASIGSSNLYHVGAGIAGTPDRANSLVGSLTGLRGIATVQQNNGDGNDIGAGTGVLADLNGAGAARQTAITDGAVTLDEYSFIGDVGSVRRNVLSGSLTNARGVVTVQQNNGNANAVSASTAVGIDRNAGSVSQRAASLGIVDSIAMPLPTVGLGAARTNGLDGSLNGARGLFTIQQNNGDGNALGTANAVNAHVGRGRLDRADQSATAASNLRFGYTRQGAGDFTGDRANAVLASGQAAAGVANLQQNNGDSNAVTSANAVNAAPAGVGRLRSAVQANAQNDSGDTDALGAGIAGRTDRGNTVAGQTGAGFRGMATLQQNNGDSNGLSAAAGVQVTGAGEESNYQVGGVAGATWLGTVDTGGERRNRVEGSFANARGLIAVQQNNGDNNAMASATGVGAQLGSGNLRQTTDASSTIAGGTVFNGEPGNRSLGGERTNAVTDSFRDGRGLMTVQQNNGNGNALNNATSLLAGLGTGDNGTATQSTRAGGAAAFGDTLDDEAPAGMQTGVRDNAVSEGAFDGARGIATVQQNNGSNNALGAATSVNAIQGGGTSRNSGVTAASDSSFNTATARRAGTSAARDRSNGVGGSFTNFRGVATVQQNGGDGNALSAATGLAASRSGDETARRQTATANTNVNAPLAPVLDQTPLVQRGVSAANAVTQGFDGAAGLATVQQNTGNGNALASAAAFDLGTGGDARQSADAVGTVASVGVSSDGATRDNRVERSFTGARGVLTVQQNGGDGNGIGAVNAFALGTGSANEQATAVARLTVDSRTGAVLATDELQGNGAGGQRGTRTNTADRAFNGATGVATMQQNTGNGNSVNAGNLLQADARGGKRTAQAAVRGRAAVADNEATQQGQAAAAGVAGRANAVTGSFGAFRGIATLQQNGGDGNAMGAGTAVSANRNGRAMEEARATVDSAATVERSSARQTTRTEHRNDVAGSANNNAGILTAQQNTGNNNAMSASNAVAAVNGAAGLGTAVNLATLSATVADNRAVSAAPGNQLSNQASGSFQGIRGLSSLQQNNGHNNAMQSAIVVTATY